MPYKTVKIVASAGGYGGPVLVTPTDDKPYIGCLSGGGVNAVAKKIAELSGATAVDLMKKGIANRQMACVVVDCGGTARCAVYPLLGVKTINVMAVSPAGSMNSKAMTPDMYVAGIKVENVALAE